MRLLHDADLIDLPPGPLLAAVRDHLRADHEGRAIAPPRHRVEMGGDRAGALVFTAGGDARSVGFRAYETLPAPERPAEAPEDQIVACWDRATARLRGLAVGARLGALRTGALGGAALGATRAGHGPLDVGVVGCGMQAATQLWAAADTAAISRVHVLCRTPARREAFAAELRRDLGLDTVPSETAEAAVRGRDVVILATTARAPVIEADWIAPHAHVTTVGPKRADAHEMPLELAARAALIVSDSPAQIAAQADHMLAGDPAMAGLAHLGAHLGSAAPAVPQGIALYLSAGLAGPEVACLRAILDGDPERGTVVR